ASRRGSSTIFRDLAHSIRELSPGVSLAPAEQDADLPDTINSCMDGIVWKPLGNEAPMMPPGLTLRGAAAPGRYALSLAPSIAAREAGEWPAAWGGRADTVMDPRFLRTVERSMGAEAGFCNVVFRDASGEAAGAAFLSLYPIDGLLLAPERW